MISLSRSWNSGSLQPWSNHVGGADGGDAGILIQSLVWEERREDEAWAGFLMETRRCWSWTFRLGCYEYLSYRLVQAAGVRRAAVLQALRPPVAPEAARPGRWSMCVWCLCGRFYRRSRRSAASRGELELHASRPWSARPKTLGCNSMFTLQMVPRIESRTPHGMYDHGNVQMIFSTVAYHHRGVFNHSRTREKQRLIQASIHGPSYRIREKSDRSKAILDVPNVRAQQA
ncbi:hypothetical protein TgHK011_004006 [Trichoderma gracile]|nr:hypothetical protein TgHK011_004006 [Trichoderma gracile]